MNKIIITILITSIALTGFGCIKFSSDSAGEGGGIWKTTDQGEIWEQKTKFPTAEGVGSVAHVSVQALAIDPSDHMAIYAGTKSDGLLYTYDGAQAWQSATHLDSGPVAAVSIDPQDKCSVYAASRNKVYKSIDCNRTFEQVYFETRTDVDVTDVEVDWYNPSIVYAGTSDGDLLKSTDAGTSWSPVYRFEKDINSILVDPFDSRVIYVGTEKKGLWKSVDGGSTWIDFKEEFKEFKTSTSIYHIAADHTSEGTIIVATKYGLLRTYDGGSSWHEISLVTPPGTATITSLVMNPREGKEIFYTTPETFYKSLDGGGTWTTVEVPSSGYDATSLAIDPENSKVIYLGVKESKKDDF